MTDGGFQNYLHMIYGLPNGWVPQSSQIPDTSDILNKKKKKQEDLEEAIALRLLQDRIKEDIAIGPEVDKNKLIRVLRGKLAPGVIEQFADPTETTKRIKLILTVLALDD